MATATAAQRRDVKEFTFIWEGVDRSNRQVRGELRAAWQTVATTNLRRQGIRVLKIKKQALLDYGALVARHGGLLRRRWLLGESVSPAEILEAPEIGSLADANEIYQSVTRLKPILFRKAPVIALALAAALPLVPVLAIEVPVKDMLLKTLKMLV